MRVQLIAIRPNGSSVIVNDTNDYQFLTRIVEARDGTIWLGSDICDLVVQVIK